ncbi:isochorismatase family protein [Frankia sp. KB5]|uniref:isochorismatase family protein n=1 Tax=Frankia sp. KB5 TaxID=683318 RepID=UPI000A11828E|nr:isochorismatase family protein [Frankia sp. KB5]ORT53493.1 hypothetical protein KBI5_06670 [Frankia sp. KB5]
MALPPVPDYPMPSTDQLPPNRVGWRCTPSRAALLVHDMQAHYLAPYPEAASPRRELIENTASLCGAARTAGIPVFWSVARPAEERAERGLLWDFWGPGMAGDGARVVAPLVPAGDEGVVVKHRYSAFHRTDLLARLAAAGRDQLVICGVYAHIGVYATACDAFMSDIAPFLVADAVAAFNPDQHLGALQLAAGQCAAVQTTSQILTSWSLTTGLEQLVHPA